MEILNITNQQDRETVALILYRNGYAVREIKEKETNKKTVKKLAYEKADK